jgi:ketosteroid isomerase-like protein
MSAEGKAGDEAAICGTIENWARAVRARDIDGILTHHAPDILMFDVPPPMQSKGLAAYKKSWELFFSWAGDLGVFDIIEMQITAGNDVAFATALMRCAGRAAQGDKVELEFRLTVGLRKIAGIWTVMHEHHSIPASDAPNA